MLVLEQIFFIGRYHVGDRKSAENMKGMYEFLEDVSFKCLAGDSWNIMKSGFSFLNRLELEISILSWQRSNLLIMI